MTAWQQWRDAVKAAGGVEAPWPFRTGALAGYYGQWSAKFSAAVYQQGLAAQTIGTDRPTNVLAARDGSQWVYVLAPADAQADGPAVMTTAQRAENAIFNAGDKVASTLGLPSLSSLEKDARIVVGIAIAAGVVVLLLVAAKIRHELTA